MAAPEEIEVSIVIPCLNEEESIAECVAKARAWLERSGTHGEVIVVDNGSSDRTAELASAAGAQVVSEPLRGKGNAFQTGMRYARGRFVMMSDGDGTYDLSDLGPLLRPLTDGNDMVIGNRLSGEIAPGAMPWLHRRVGNPFFGALISLIARHPMGDVLSGLRSFRREAWETMMPASTGFELESELCLRAGRHNLKVVNVPISYAARRTPSKLRGLTHGWAIARFIILESADLILFIPGVLAIVLGVAALASGVAASEGVDVGSARWQPVFAGGILVPGGIALLTVGVAAKWIAWRRGVAAPGRIVHLLSDFNVPVGDYVLTAGFASLAAGACLDVYLLIRWALDSPAQLALGLGAVAQTLVVSGLTLLVAAVLIGVLRAEARADAAQDARTKRPDS